MNEKETERGRFDAVRTLCEEAPNCTPGRIVQVHCSSFASLLERKQKEKICVHNIPEGGV
jgi:hypothetical protein